MDKFSGELGAGWSGVDESIGFGYGLAGKHIDRETYADLVKENRKSVLCLECASGYHGISTFSYYENLMLLEETKDKSKVYKKENDGSIKHCWVDKIDYSHCINITGDIYVTDIPLTVCQMILFDCHEFHMYEAIDGLYTYHKDIVEETERMAKDFGILDKLLEYRELAEQAYLEDNE